MVLAEDQGPEPCGHPDFGLCDLACFLVLILLGLEKCKDYNHGCDAVKAKATSASSCERPHLQSSMSI